MEVLVNIGVVVEAKTIKEALEKIDVCHSWGVVTGIGAVPRPQGQLAQPPGTPMNRVMGPTPTFPAPKQGG